MVSLRPALIPGSNSASAQLLRYVLIGAANTLVSYGFYALGLAIGFRYELASLIALVLGIIVSFVTQGRLVFLTRLRNRFPLFLATWAILYFVNITVIRVLNWAGLDLYLAGLAAIVPVTGIAFLLQKNIVFAEPRPAVMRVVLIGLLLLLAAARLDLVVRFEVNWDEFLNLAMVHSFARGELREVLQTAFVHLFFWVPGVAVNEVDQIIAARLFVMLVAFLTSIAIYRTSRNFVGISAALFAVLAFNGFSFVIRHGNSLRTDPLAACCLMVAIWLALVRDFTIRRSVAVGALVGLAGALTIKSFFYVPTVGAILLLHIWYDADRKSAIWLAGLSALTALASFVAVVALHSSSFPATASASAFIARTSGATVLSGDYSIVLDGLLQAIARNFFFWIVLLIGVLCAGGMLRYPSHRRKGLTLLSLTLTLASLIVYRDAYPYYYPFMLAPVAVVVGFGFERISNLRNGLYAWAAIALVLVSATITYWQSRGQDNSGQRRVLGLVHQLFPHPVAYIDHTSMVSSYPKQGFFMSRWGVTDYRRTRTPIMNDIIGRNEPRFLLVTRALLDVERLNPQDAGRRPYSLLTADIDVLRKNYIRYWGPIYLPGFQVKGSGDRQVQIPGDYIVQSTNPVLVDGRSILPGATIKLAKGNHRIVSNTSASFSWAAPAPPAEKPPRQLFRGF